MKLIDPVHLCFACLLVLFAFALMQVAAHSRATERGTVVMFLSAPSGDL